MNKKLISAAIVATLTSGASFSAGAALASNAILQFASGVPSYTASGAYTVNSGSYFTMDYNADGIFSLSERTAMKRLNGVYINGVQPASGSHGGYPDGTGIASIDAPFSFFGNTGMHQTTSPVRILSDNGAGHVALNFSGWGITWNGIPNIPLGGDRSQGDNHIATLLCGSTCSQGDTFSLRYTAHVPINDPSGFGGVYYGVRLVGVIGPAAVPVPAAAWLFGSGLIGLVAAARRRIAK